MSARALPLALALVAVALYLPTLGNAFIRDDDLLLAPARHLESFPLARAFVDNSWNPIGRDTYYRPMVFLTHRLDLGMWGRDPAGHHLTNLVLYGALVWLLARLALIIGYSPWAASIATLLFAVHPSHVETVAWISGRSDLIAAMFATGWLLVIVGRDRSRSSLVLAWACLLAALLGKEVAIAVPVAALALTLCPRTDGTASAAATLMTSPSLDWRHWLLGVLPPLILYAMLRVSCLGVSRSYLYGFPTSTTELVYLLVLSVRLLGRYLATLSTGYLYGPYAADEMMMMRAQESRSMSDHALAELDLEWGLAAVALLGFMPWLVRRVREDRFDRVSALLATGSLLLAMNFTSAQVQILFADRYLFLPSLGAALLLAAALTRLSPSRVTSGLFLVIALSWMRSTGSVVPHYRDLVTFFEMGVRVNPASAFAHRSLGLTLVRQDTNADTGVGRTDEGLDHLRMAWALSRHPSELTWLLQGLILADQLPAASELAQANLERIQNPDILVILSRLAMKARRVEEGRAFARRALALAPGHTGALELERRLDQGPR